MLVMFGLIAALLVTLSMAFAAMWLSTEAASEDKAFVSIVMAVMSIVSVFGSVGIARAGYFVNGTAEWRIVESTDGTKAWKSMTPLHKMRDAN